MIEGALISRTGDMHHEAIRDFLCLFFLYTEEFLLEFYYDIEVIAPFHSLRIVSRTHRERGHGIYFILGAGKCPLRVLKSCKAIQVAALVCARTVL